LSFTHTVNPRFPEDTIVYYKLFAKNGVGFSPESSHLVVLTPRKPIFMHQPVNVSVSAFTIVVTWDQVTDYDLRGRDAITYYTLEWDQGTGVWVELNSRAGGLVTSFT